MSLSTPFPSVAASVAILCMSGALVCGAALPAAAESADPTITWAVSPADASGPDDRSWIELETGAGQTLSEHLAVQNLSEIPVEFDIHAADGYFTDDGRFNMLPAHRESVAAGTWIEVQDAVTVEPGATAIVPFTVSVPEDAPPGDHAAGIAASVLSVGGTEGAELSVHSRIGVRVMTRVTGELAPALAVDDVEARYHMSWNPFEPGYITVSYTVEDNGNTRLAVIGEVSGPGTTRPPEREHRIELLPGDRRTLTARIDQAWPIGLASVTIDASASVLPEGEAGTVATPDREVVHVWAMPWPQLIIAAAVSLLFLAAWRNRRKRVDLAAQVRELSRDHEANRDV